MSHAAQELTDLIGSRICHDLISPLGAISNGLELLAMSVGTQGPEVDLITDSVESASARIKFFRIAFGAAQRGQGLGEKEIKAILRDVSRASKTVFEWQAKGPQNRAEVKLVFLLLQCFETALPWGGHVAISELGGEWAIHGSAERMQIDPDLWQILSAPGDYPGLAPSKVQFALAPLTANAIGRRLIVESAETSARVRF